MALNDVQYCLLGDEWLDLLDTLRQATNAPICTIKYSYMCISY